MKFVRELANWFTYIQYMIKEKKVEIGKIKSLHFIINANPAPNGGIGGPSTSLSMMQEIIGDVFLGMDVRYSFGRPVKYFGKKVDPYSMMGAIRWVNNLVKDEKDTLYVTHDCGTAAALCIAGKRYIYTSHTQGPVVEEMQHFDFKISFLARKLIYSIEKKAYNNALSVQFPSYGAREAFMSCDNKAKGIKFIPGPIIYNTLYARSREEKLRPLKKEEDTLTFLSIGNITKQNGFDRHVLFFREYLKLNKNKIRYIVRGNGRSILSSFIRDMKDLENEFPNFLFIHIAKRVSGEQLEYLKKISDIYIMLHRVSIFDMATLEMFGLGRTAVLSNVGGNIELNKNKNIILVNEGNYELAARELASSNIEDLGGKCIEVYKKYFSNKVFFSSYEDLVRGLI